MRSHLHVAASAAVSLVVGAGMVSAGCSSSDGTADAADGGFAYPAFMPSLPQASNLFGGRTLKDFTVVPVLFAGDPTGARAPEFLTKYAASPEWVAAVGEYGVGAMTIAAPIILNETAPPTISDD